MNYLKLVANNEVPVTVASIKHAKVGELALAGHLHVVNNAPKHFAYRSLLLVIAFHLLGLYWLLSAHSPTPELTDPMPPMMVSLVANPVSAPAVKEVQPVVSQPVKKIIAPQNKPVTKKIIVKEAEMAQPNQEPVHQESVNEPVIEPTAPVDEAKHEKPTELVAEKVEAPAAKVEAQAVIEPPRFGAAYLNNPAPEYPSLSRRMGEEGRVLLRVLVSEEGLAETVDLEKTSGSERLDAAAMQAVKKWSFIPAKKNNQAMRAYVLVPVKFSLKN